jgi:hypothetical protein
MTIRAMHNPLGFSGSGSLTLAIAVLLIVAAAVFCRRPEPYERLRDLLALLLRHRRK